MEYNKILCVSVFTAAAAVAAAAVYVKMRGLRDIASTILDQAAEIPTKQVDVMRSEFSKLEIPRVEYVMDYHTHPVAASNRSSGSLAIDLFGNLTGLLPYYVQCSKADERKNRQGSRSYYWAKDIGVTPKVLDPPDNSILALVDVDYYVEMPSFLNNNFLPTILYSFQPNAAARVGHNYDYWFEKDASVEYRIAGGGKYRQHVWSYSQDHLMAVSHVYGIPWKATTYLVDRRSMDADHELILLTPTARWWGPFAFLATFMLSYKILERLNPVVNEHYVRLRVHRTEGPYISTGIVGRSICATIPVALDEAIALTAKHTKVGLTCPQVESLLPPGDDTRQHALVLLDYHKSPESGYAPPPPCVYPLEDAVQRYQYDPKEYDPDAKQAVTPFMSPIIAGMCFAPDITKNNEQACINGRINAIKAPADLKMTPFLQNVMAEFVEKFIPNPHMAIPVDEEYVFEKQDRPAQRHILHAAEFMEPKRVINMFLKRECYPEPKDPRPISTINGCDKMAYSKYIYALAEHVKAQPWYAFGKTPKQVALRVTELCCGATSVAKTDFSRFDGRVSKLVRTLEQMILMRYFRTQYHDEILELHRSQYQLRAFSTFGIQYDTGDARASGSPETAALNSLVNAFVAFLAHRMTNINGCFIGPDEAYEKLGVYGGDDGLTADVDSEKYLRAATMIGQKLELEVVKRGELGVMFLARVYGPDVWFGDSSSCCDLPRQLAKFHVTVTLPSTITPAMKLVEKATAFFLTDANTPVLGQFCETVMRLSDGRPQTKFLNIWNSDVPQEEHYPNEPREWYVDYAINALPGFHWIRAREWLNSVRTLEDMLSPPLCMEPRAPPPQAVPVVVNRQIIRAKPTPDRTNVPAPITTKKSRRITPRAVEPKTGRPGRRPATDSHHATTTTTVARGNRPQKPQQTDPQPAVVRGGRH